MSKLSFRKSKFSKFITSKGFYVALALCVAGAGTATWFAVDRTIGGIERNSARPQQNENFFNNFPKLEEVEQKQPDIPQENTPPSVPRHSSSTSSLPLEEPPKQQEQSETSTAPQPLPKLIYALPVKGEIINPHSGGELVKNQTLGDWRTHDGIDVAAEKGADICAAADGIVAEIRNDPLWGTVVVIDHADGNQSVYCGLNKNVPVKVGEQVSVRQAIGKLEGVPCEISEKLHLHFAMRRDNAWVDPLEVIAG